MITKHFTYFTRTIATFAFALVFTFMPYGFAGFDQINWTSFDFSMVSIKQQQANAAGDGTIGNPFTDIFSAYEASGVGGFTAGIYNFDIGGNTFSSYVDTEGYVLIASADLAEVNDASGYTQVTAMTLQSDDILSSAIVTSMLPTELKFDSSNTSTSAGGVVINMTTSDATTLARFSNYESLAQIVGDGRTSGTPGSLWTGVNDIQADCLPGSSTLDQIIWHACGGAGDQLHWFPNQANQDGFGDNVNDTEMNLWARDITENIAPGGVAANLNLWLRANEGVVGGAAVSSWADQSGNSNDVAQGTASFQPNATANTVNFNPTVSFDGGDALQNLNANFATGSGPKQVFIVSNNISGSTGTGLYLGQNTATAQQNISYGFSTAESSLLFSGLNDNGVISRSHINGSGPIIHTYGNAAGEVNYDFDLSTNASVSANPTGVVTSFVPNISGTRMQVGSKRSADPSTNGFVTGDISEIIFYEQDVADAQELQIESYLALKYGVTLDQTAAQNYLTSNGTTDMWTNDSDGYNHDIFGIGKDTGSALDQRISQSVNTDAILTISTDTNFADANDTHVDSLTDLQFLTIANNDAGNDATATQRTERVAGYDTRATREWKVDNEGGVGAVNLKFDGYDDTWIVVIDDDGNFNGGTQSELGTLSATGELTGVTLSDGDYFTLMQESVDVEFSERIAASTDESAADNFPVLLINGEVTAATSIGVQYVNSFFFTTATDGGTDFTFTNPTTIAVPAGVYDGTLATAITIPAPTLNNDAIIENDERIRFILTSNPIGLRVGDADGDLYTSSGIFYTITDDDEATVVVDVTDNLTTEDGTDTGEITVVLQSQPTADVTVNLEIQGADQAEGAFDAGGTLFTTTVVVPAASWNIPQTLTIFGLDEAVDDGNYTFTVVAAGATSADANYVLADADIADVTLINQDDDISDIIVTSTDNETTETGNTATVTLTPSSAPTADVTVPVFISDPAEGSIAIAEVVLPSGSTAGVDIIITGLDDLLADGNVIYQIYFGDPTSTDANYDALLDIDVAPQNLVNIDNEINESPVPTGPVSGDSVSSATIVSGSCSLALAGGTARFETNPIGGLDPEPQTMTLDTNGDYSGTLNWSSSAIGNTYGLVVTCIDSGGNEVTPYEITPLTITAPPSTGGRGGGSKRVSKEQIAAIFGTPQVTSTPDTLGKGEQCSTSQILTQNMKAGARNGQFNSYTGSTATEVKILQAHMNRLGFASGPEDGILGPITDGAIKRMQAFLGTTQDGYVGPITRSLINNSCGETPEEPVVETPEVVEDAQCFINYTRLIKRGMTGNDVKQAQVCVASLGHPTGPFDGIYGGLTYAGIRSYQLANNLMLDGIIGPETAGHLNALSGVALNGVTLLN